MTAIAAWRRPGSGIWAGGLATASRRRSRLGQPGMAQECRPESRRFTLVCAKNLIASRAMKAVKISLSALLGLCLSLSAAAPAHAFPGFLASKKSTDVKIHSTQMVVMKKGNATAVTVMPDYEGPL